MKLLLFFSIITLTGCNVKSTQANIFDQKINFTNLIDSYIFLSENHDLLHIMMGEYEGSPIDSYNEYKIKIDPLIHNIYLKPIVIGLNNIQVQDSNILKNADKFDALVDYYQIGIQMMIEGILKGYGYNGEMPQNTKDYENIKKINF